VIFSTHAKFLEQFADGVADAAPSAARNAIDRAKASGLDISYIEDGRLTIEAPDGTIRWSQPITTGRQPI